MKNLYQLADIPQHKFCYQDTPSSAPGTSGERFEKNVTYRSKQSMNYRDDNGVSIFVSLNQKKEVTLLETKKGRFPKYGANRLWGKMQMAGGQKLWVALTSEDGSGSNFEKVNKSEKKEKERVQSSTTISLKAVKKKVIKEKGLNSKEYTLPDWFVNAENDAVRVATLNEVGKGFEQFARHSNGGGNEAKIVRALKAVNAKAFSDVIFNGHPKGEKLVVSVGALKKLNAMSDLDDEDLQRILILFEKAVKKIHSELDKGKIDDAYISKFNSQRAGSAKRPQNASLLDKRLLVKTFGGDIPLEVEVLDTDNLDKFKVLVAKSSGFERKEINGVALDTLVKGGNIPLNNNMVLTQAQGRVMEVEKAKNGVELKHFSLEDGRDINIDMDIYSKLRVPDDLLDGHTTKAAIIRESVHYLVNMLETSKAVKYLRVTEGGDIFLTGGDLMKKIFQEILDKSFDKDDENHIHFNEIKIKSRDEPEETKREFRVHNHHDNINAITHRVAEKLFTKDSEKLEWDVNRITNVDLDRFIEGATLEEKVKLFGITLSEMERELSRDEFVAFGAKTDYFQVFERKMNTDLEKLLKDKVIKNRGKYKTFEDKVVTMGEARWNEIEAGKGFFAKNFGKKLSADAIRNIKFRMGAYLLLGRSNKEGTDLASEFKRIYEGTSTQISGINKVLTTPDEQAVLSGFGLCQKNINDIFSVGAAYPPFAELHGSDISFGVGIRDINDGSDPDVPEDTRERVSHGSWSTNSSRSGSSSVESSKSNQSWSKEQTWQEEKDGYIYTYTKIDGDKSTTNTTDTTTTTTTKTTTHTKDVYKVTKYKKENPKAKLEFTIDMRQNLITIHPSSGFDFGLDARAGAAINQLSGTKGYLALKLGAEGRFTTKTKLNTSIGAKLNTNGDLSGLASIDLSHQISDKMKIFAGASNTSFEAFDKLFDLDRATASLGASYSFDNHWDLEGTMAGGDSLVQLSLILKKNKQYFIEGMKKAIEEQKTEENFKKIDAHIKLIHGKNVDVTQYRDEAAVFFGGMQYANSLGGNLSKLGISFAEIGTDKLVSLVFGFITSADLVKQVYAHENKRQENLRAYLQKSGEHISKLRHATTFDLSGLAVDETANTYHLLKPGYAAQYLPQNYANMNKYVEVNTYIDPKLKNRVTVNGDGTFTITGEQDIKPFVLVKTLADGNVEFNISLGDYSASRDSANLMSSGRIRAGEDMKLSHLSEKLNTGTEKVSRQRRLEKRMGAFSHIEKILFKEMHKNRDQIVAIEQQFRVDTSNQEKIKALGDFRDFKLSDLNYSNSKTIVLAEKLDKYAADHCLRPYELVNSIAKARMKFDNASKVENGLKSNKAYVKLIKKKRAYVNSYAGGWKEAMQSLGADESELGTFADPSTALRLPDEINENDVRSYSGGRGYIMAPGGQAVVMNKVNGTKVMHPKEKTITTNTGTYKIITGYLKECRNPMFIIQKVRPNGGTRVSDQEYTASQNGLDIHSIDLALGLHFTPPKVSSETTFDTVYGSSTQYHTHTETTSSSQTTHEDLEETTFEREETKEEPPDTQDPVF